MIICLCIYSGFQTLYIAWLCFQWQKDRHAVYRLAKLCDTRGDLNTAMAHVIVHWSEDNRPLAMKWDEEAKRLIRQAQEDEAQAVASLKV